MQVPFVKEQHDDMDENSVLVSIQEFKKAITCVVARYHAHRFY